MKKVITYGTFDLFHRGHYNILKRAKEYGDYLIVGVTGDSYDVSRGKLSVHDDLGTRIDNVKQTGLVDAIIVEEYLGQKISDVIRYDVDVLVIGDDWRGKFDHLKKYCDVVYLERTKNISSTQIREEKLENYNIGIIADRCNDNQIVRETTFVNELHVNSVYASDISLANRFAAEYNIPNATDSFADFVEKTDIVYIRCALERRSEFIKRCIQAKKHVICDPPFCLSKREQEELFRLAKAEGVALIDNVKMVYVQVFNQLLWMTQGGLIGDIIKFECSVSKQDKSIKDLFDGLLAMALCPMVKVMGTDYTKIIPKLTKEDGGIEFGTVTFEYATGEATIKVGNSVRVKNQMEIIGTKGTIRLKDNWWKSNYFELEETDATEIKVYNMNFEGNGFRFLLRAMLTMFGNGKTESMGLFPEESIKIAEIIEYVHGN